MPNTVLQSIADSFVGITQTIVELEDLISATREAGEDVTTQSAELALLKQKAANWESMLKARGYLT